MVFIDFGASTMMLRLSFCALAILLVPASLTGQVEKVGDVVPDFEFRQVLMNGDGRNALLDALSLMRTSIPHAQPAGTPVEQIVEVMRVAPSA